MGELTRGLSKGFEDFRIAFVPGPEEAGGGLWFTATSPRDWKKPQPYLGRIRGQRLSGAFHLSGLGRKVKNLLPFGAPLRTLHVLDVSGPTVYALRDPAEALRHTESDVGRHWRRIPLHPAWGVRMPRGLHGGSPPAHLDGDRWCLLAHTARTARRIRRYTHYYLEIDLGRQEVVFVSPPFRLMGGDIEFASGAVPDLTLGEIHISFGLYDRESWLGKADLERLRMGLMGPAVAVHRNPEQVSADVDGGEILMHPSHASEVAHRRSSSP